LTVSGDFVFDAVGLLYTVEIVTRFYTVQYEHMKRDVAACASVLFQISWSMFLPKIDKRG